MKLNKLKEGSFTGNTLKSQRLDRYILSITEHDPNLQVGRHAHEHSYISLLLHGFYNEQSRQAEQELVAGTSLFRVQGYEHKNEIGPARSLCFNLELKTGFFDNELLDMQSPCFRFEHNNLEILKMFLAFKQDFSTELLDLTLDENAYLLFSRNSINPRTQHKQWAEKIKREVRLQPELKYSIDEVAASLHMHPVYFVRKFKQITGHTFGEYLIRQRLSRSIDLIHHSAMNLTQIALASGFYDQSHFIRRFKEAFNITPSDYISIVKS